MAFFVRVLCLINIGFVQGYSLGLPSSVHTLLCSTMFLYEWFASNVRFLQCYPLGSL